MISPSELRTRLQGPVVAMTTHFKDDYSLDLDAMRRLTEYYIEQRVPTVIVTGSTGEFFELSDEERRQVQTVVVETAHGSDMTVICGASHSGSHLTIDMVHHAERIGAHGAMITPPYYGTNGGGFPVIAHHYDFITRRIDLPVVIYFSGAVLWQVAEPLANPGMMVELVDVCNGKAAGFKDGSGNFGFYRDVSRQLGERISVMGSYGMNYYLWGRRFGSRCFLTGLGNIWPRWEIEFGRHMERGDMEAAERIVNEKDLLYLEVTKATRRYWACVKALQEMQGLPGGPMRPPLVDCTPEQRAELRRVCTRIGLLEPAAVAA